MPEGDSIARSAAALRRLVGGVVQASSPHPQGRATGVARAIDGRVLEAVDTHGKHLLLRFSGGVTVRSHLRMRGRWVVLPAGEAVVGSPWLVLETPLGTAVQRNGPVLTLEQRPLARLGADVLADRFDPPSTIARLRTRPAELVGAALLDQTLVAGLGTVWVSEALFAGRVHPGRRLRDVADAELHAVLDAAREGMRAALDGKGRPGFVYRRAGRGCRQCATPIDSLVVGDQRRTLYFCPRCQRA